MAVVDTAVDDGHGHFVTAGLRLPCLEEVDVGAPDSCADVAEVLIVPLVGQTRVVEEVVDAGGLHWRPGHGAETAGTLFEYHRGYGFGKFDAGGGGKYFAGLSDGHAFVEAYHVPAVESVTGALLGKLRAIWQHGPDRHGLDLR